jgi:Putative prokaryotic signal transducing protein
MTSHPEPAELLTSTPTEMEASIIVAALAQEEIRATMTGQYTAGFRAEAPGWVQILVADGDLARAKEVLDDVKRTNTEIDWSQVDVGQPEDET